MSRTSHACAFYTLILLALGHLIAGRRLVDVDETAAAGSAPD